MRRWEQRQNKSWETEGSTVASRRIEDLEQRCLPELPQAGSNSCKTPPKAAWDQPSPRAGELGAAPAAPPASLSWAVPGVMDEGS